MKHFKTINQMELMVLKAVFDSCAQGDVCYDLDFHEDAHDTFESMREKVLACLQKNAEDDPDTKTLREWGKSVANAQ